MRLRLVHGLAHRLTHRLVHLLAHRVLLLVGDAGRAESTMLLCSRLRLRAGLAKVREAHFRVGRVVNVNRKKSFETWMCAPVSTIVADSGAMTQARGRRMFRMRGRALTCKA